MWKKNGRRGQVTDNIIQRMGFTCRIAERGENIHNPVTGLEWPRGIQEIKVPIIHANGTGWW